MSDQGKVDIYLPRLDVTFKKGPVPKDRGPVAPIRVHWQKFVKCLHNSLSNNGHIVRVIEIPLWQITPELVRELSSATDHIFIPHKMRLNWYLNERVLYYMQMVIPNIFSIDSSGWCASSSVWPLIAPLNTSSKDKNLFASMSNRITNNISKFQQVQYTSSNKLPKKYVVFPCQIPHDETIKYHSDVSVEQALSAVLHWAAVYDHSYSIIIKGHPANIQAMQPLRALFNKFKLSNPDKDNVLWIDDISIHQLISGSSAVLTVNSGVGLEALLHCKPVLIFGNADYSDVASKIIYGGSISNAADSISWNIKNLPTDQEAYRDKCIRFISCWYNAHFDYKDPSTFVKIKEYLTKS